MAKDKISSQEIVELMAEQAGITKKLADEFLRAMFSTIEETLLSGDSVKIKKFGTFKLQKNAARKSVNVQTGDKIVIPGYYKVSFVPDVLLKEAVNEPFSHLESVNLDEQIEPEIIVDGFDQIGALSEQASEIKAILSEIQSLSDGALQDQEVIEKEEEAELFVKEINDSDLQEKEEGQNEDNKLDEPAPLNDQDDVELDEDNELDEDEDEDEDETEVEEDEADDNQNDTQDELSELIVEQAAFEEVEDITEVSKAVVLTESVELEVEASLNEHVVNSIEVSEPEVQDTAEIIIAAQVDSDGVGLIKSELDPDPELTNAVGMEDNAEPFVLSDTVPPVIIEPPLDKQDNRANKKRNSKGCLIVSLVLLSIVVGGVITYHASSCVRCWVNYDLLSDNNRNAFANYQTKILGWFSFDKEVAPLNQDIPETIHEPIVVGEVNDDLEQYVDSMQLFFDAERVYSEFIGSERIINGSSLTRFSLRYYGHREYWVYIYEANRDRVTDPNNIAIGTLIKVPKLDKKLIDADNPRTFEQAQKLHDLYIK